MRNVKVGVAVFALRQDKTFIIGKRKGSHGAGAWGLPGGHIDYGETFEACARRELVEETGLEIEQIRFLTATNDRMTTEGKHYVTIFLAARLCDDDAEPEVGIWVYPLKCKRYDLANSASQVKEPDKCEEWQWVTWDDIVSEQAKGVDEEAELQRRRLFMPLVSLLEQREGFSLHSEDKL
ncbi:7,8-dihydro-8-oxoguanine triphosphatase NUDT15 [Aspergillus carlsbadensis]|nr:7,8-dihydro-8-oxoguanine triphosphatase NUDT15 [Aspergillus carlsbadensis]